MFQSLSLSSVAVLLITFGAVSADANDAVQEILDSASGGLVVQLGCGDARRIAEPAGHGNWLVQALDTDAAKVDAARKHLHEADLYGPVSADTFDGRHLPCAENLVNLIVAEQLGDVSEAEAMRVLAPNGVLCVKEDGRWMKAVKPRPENIDEWTHYAYDAGN